VAEMSFGVNPRTRLRCAGCGYGAATDGETPTCPMCGESNWEHLPWRPFTDELDRALHAQAARKPDSQDDTAISPTTPSR
jgi:rubredoxin